MSTPRQAVGDHVRRLHGVGAGRDRRLPEPVEPAGDEDDGAVEIEVGLDPSDPPRRALRHLGAQALDQLGGRLDRDEVGLGEVAVVVGLLLRAPRRERAAAGVEIVRLLDDLSAGLVDGGLPCDLGVDPLGDEAERVHVLQLAAGAQLRRPRRPDRDVGVDTQCPLLHLGVRDPELDDRLPQKLQEAAGVLGGVDVGAGDDLDERRAASIEVDERVVGAADPAGAPADMRRLRRILLEMRANDPDLVVTIGRRH